MVKDRLEEIWEKLNEDERLTDISIKSFVRDSKLDDTETSIVLIPVAPPMQTNFGSNASLSKVFLLQVNVESTDRKTCKELQRIIEKIMESESFYQTVGGLDEYIEDLKRYVDARTYKGVSKLYDDY